MSASLIDLNPIKPILETIDWLVKKYKEADDALIKAKLSKIADQISKLAINKAEYLVTLKNEVKAGRKVVDLSKVHSAIATAEADTKELRRLLEEFNFDSKKIGFSLKYGVEKLSKVKVLKLSELKEIIARDVVSNQDHERIITELESFEAKWIELGSEIDKRLQLVMPKPAGFA